MTDRELLELAAKASGIGIMPCTCSSEKWPFKHNESATGKRGHWNPLVSDGDALRLAVKLMEFDPYKSRGYLPCITSDAEFTRRAIVRAAAEIGKAMP